MLYCIEVHCFCFSRLKNVFFILLFTQKLQSFRSILHYRLKKLVLGYKASLNYLFHIFFSTVSLTKETSLHFNFLLVVSVLITRSETMYCDNYVIKYNYENVVFWALTLFSFEYIILWISHHRHSCIPFLLFTFISFIHFHRTTNFIVDLTIASWYSTQSIAIVNI